MTVTNLKELTIALFNDVPLIIFLILNIFIVLHEFGVI